MKTSIRIFAFVLGLMAFVLCFNSGIFAEKAGVLKGWSIVEGKTDSIKENKGRVEIRGKAENDETVIKKELNTEKCDKLLLSYTLKVIELPEKSEKFFVLCDSNDSVISKLALSGYKMAMETMQDGEIKSFDIPMMIEEGREYKIGYILDFVAKTQKFYIFSEGEFYETEKSFYTSTVSAVDRMELRPSAGTFYISDVNTDIYSLEKFIEFRRLFEKNNIKVDSLDDIKALLSDEDMIFYTNTPYVITKERRKLIDGDRTVVAPIERNGKIYFPAIILTELGFDISYNDKTGEVTIANQETKMSFELDSREYTMNGKKLMDTEKIGAVNGRTMLPADMVELLSKKSVNVDKSGMIALSENGSFFEKIDKKLLSRIEKTFGLFVSTDGNDIGDGTIRRPLKTVEAAKNKIKSLKKAGGIPEGGYIAYFRQGYYRTTKTWSFTEEDSGSFDAPITYMAFPGEEVSFTGAVNIPWKEFEPVTNNEIKERLYENVRDKVMQVDLKKFGIRSISGCTPRGNGTEHFKEEYVSPSFTVNGKIETMARWPNSGYAKTGQPIKLQIWTGAESDASDTPIERWGNAKDAWIAGSFKWYWASNVTPVEIDAENKKIITKFETYDGIEANKDYYFFNILEELDIPGEWFVDRETMILYYYPEQYLDVENAQFEFSGGFDDNLIEMNNVSYVSFNGIDFKGTPAKGIAINECSNIGILGGDFTNIWNTAVYVDSSYYININGCNFYDLGIDALDFRNCGDMETLRSSNIVVDNCYGTKLGNYLPQGIFMKFGGENITLRNCEIQGMDKSAIAGSVEGGGGRDHLIENCEIYNCSITGEDNGAVYYGLRWEWLNWWFNNNYFHDNEGIFESCHSLYWDDGMYSMFATNNLFHGGPTGERGQIKNVFYGDVVEGNVFVDAPGYAVTGVRGAMADDLKTQLTPDKKSLATPETAKWGEMLSFLWRTPFTNEFWKSKYPQLYNRLYSDDVGVHKHIRIKNNLAVNSKFLLVHDDWVKNNHYPEYDNIVENNIETTDTSMFADYENKDFRIVGDVGIDNFVGPNVDTMGLYMSDYRTDKMPFRDFSLTSPVNGETDVDANKVELVWEYVPGAVWYRVEVAEDADFNNIIYTNTVRWQYSDSPSVDFEFAETTYFWRVTAIGNGMSRKGEKQCSRVYSFTTAKKDIIDTAQLTEKLIELDNEIRTAVVGDSVGGTTQQVYNNMVSVYGEAEKSLENPDFNRRVLNEQIANIDGVIDTYKKSRKVGHVDLLKMIDRNDSMWVAGEPNFYQRTEDMGLRLESSVGDMGNTGVVFGYDRKVGNYPIWTFKAIFDAAPENLGYQGISLRASSSRAICWTGGYSYIFILKEDVIEMQCWGGDMKGRVLFESVPNTFFKNGKECLVEVGATDIPGGGVHLLLKIDGKTVFDYEHIEEGNYLDVEGYLSFLAPANHPLYILPAGNAMPQD